MSPKNQPNPATPLTQLHDYLSKHDYDVPADPKDFPDWVQQDGRLERLHKVLLEDKQGAEVTPDYKQFESALFSGEDAGKKKAPADQATGNASGAGAEANKPFVSQPPTAADSVPPMDVAMQAEAAGQPATGTVADTTAPALVEDKDMAAYLQAHPEERARVIEEEAQTLGAVQEGFSREIYHQPDGPVNEVTTYPNGPNAAPVVTLEQAKGDVGEHGVYSVPGSKTGIQYIDKPLSKEVDGKEQSQDDAQMLTMRNELVKGFQAFGNVLGSADRTLRRSKFGQALDKAGAAIGLNGDPNRGNVFQDGADAMQPAIKPVAPYYERSKALGMQVARAAGMALPVAVSLALPEGRAAKFAADLIGANFDGQIMQGSFDRAEAAGIPKGSAEYDNYALADATASMLVFKLGGAGLNKVGQGLLKTALLKEVSASLQATGERWSGAAVGTAFEKAVPRALLAVKNAAKGGMHLGPLMAANTIKEKVGEHLENQRLGRAAFAEHTLGQDAVDVLTEGAKGFGIGAASGAFTRAPKPAEQPETATGPTATEGNRLLPIETPGGKKFFAELDAENKPVRIVDEQGVEQDADLEHDFAKGIIADGLAKEAAATSASAGQPTGPQPIPEGAGAEYADQPWHENIDLGIEHEGKPVLADVTPDGKYFELHDGSGDGTAYTSPDLHRQAMELLPAKLAELQVAPAPEAAPAEPVAPEVQPEAVAEPGTGGEVARMVSGETKASLDKGKAKIVDDGQGNFSEQATSHEDESFELEAMAAKASKGKLTFGEFQKSYFGQSIDGNGLAEARAEFEKDPAAFIAEIQRHFDAPEPAQADPSVVDVTGQAEPLPVEEAPVQEPAVPAKKTKSPYHAAEQASGHPDVDPKRPGDAHAETPEYKAAEDDLRSAQHHLNEEGWQAWFNRNLHQFREQLRQAGDVARLPDSKKSAKGKAKEAFDWPETDGQETTMPETPHADWPQWAKDFWGQLKEAQNEHADKKAFWASPEGKARITDSQAEVAKKTQLNDAAATAETHPFLFSGEPLKRRQEYERLSNEADTLFAEYEKAKSAGSPDAPDALKRWSAAHEKAENAKIALENAASAAGAKHRFPTAEAAIESFHLDPYPFLQSHSGRSTGFSQFNVGGAGFMEVSPWTGDNYFVSGHSFPKETAAHLAKQAGGWTFEDDYGHHIAFSSAAKTIAFEWAVTHGSPKDGITTPVQSSEPFTPNEQAPASEQPAPIAPEGGAGPEPSPVEAPGLPATQPAGEAPAEPQTPDTAPEGQKERQHPLHYDEATQAALPADARYYTPRTRIQNATEATSFIDEHGLDNAYKFVMANEFRDANGEELHEAVQDDLRGQVRAKLEDASVQAAKAGNPDEAARLLQQSIDVLGERAKARTKAAQVLAQFRSNYLDNPEQAKDDFVASIAAMKEDAAARNKKPAAAADKEATTRRKAKVEEVLADDKVKEAAARVTEWAVTGQKKATGAAKSEPTTAPDAPTWGSKNKIFTKESIAASKAALKKLGLSSVVPPELLHLVGYHMEAGARSFAEVSKRVLRDVGNKVKPLLADAYEEAKARLIAKGDSGQGFDGKDGVAAALSKELAENLADRIVAEVRPTKPGVFNPAQEMLDTLTKRVRETLPAEAKKPKSPREAIVHALQNKVEYADVFDQSKALVEAKIGALKISDAAKAKMKAELSAYRADTIGDPFAVRQLDGAMREGMKELGQKLEKLVRQHADVREAAKGSLIDKLVNEAGLTPAQAKEYADAIGKRFAELSAKKAQTLAGRILTPLKAKLPGSKTRTVVDKLSEALDIADATTAGPDNVSPAAALLEKMTGIPDVTVEDIEAFRDLSDKLRAASKPKPETIGGKTVDVIDTKARDKALTDLLRYTANRTKSVSFWHKVRALQYAFRLSGLDTQGRNLKANVLHTAFEQGIVTPLYNVGKNGSIHGAGGGFRGYLSGQKAGVAEAAYTMRTGYAGGVQEKFGDNSPLEQSKSKFMRAWARVSRAMVAGDQLTSIPTEASRTHEVALQVGFELARDEMGLSGKKGFFSRELRDKAYAKANEILYKTKEAIADIHHIVEQEGLAEITLADVRAGKATMAEYTQRAEQRNIRIADLLRQARAADNPELVNEAKEYARIQTLNGDVPGQMGRLLDAVATIGKDNPVADAVLTNIMPFLKIPANSLLRKLEWGLPPLTAMRAALGRTSLTMRSDSKYSRELTREEQHKLYIRAAVGTAVWATFGTLMHNGTISVTGLAKNKDDGDLLQPPQTVKIGDHLFNYKDTNLEYPLTIMAALNDYVRKQHKKGADPHLAKLLSVAAIHSGAWMLTTGPVNGPADLGNVLIQANQGNYESAGSYFKRFALAPIKTGVVPAILNQAGQAYRDWSGAAQRERKSNSLPNELLVSFFGSIPFADVGEDKINVWGDPIVVNRDGLAVWKDEQGKQMAAELVALDLMPPRQAPTDDRLTLFDPVSGDQVTPLSDAEFHDYAVARGKGLREQLTMPRGEMPTLMQQIEKAATRKEAVHLRDVALEQATTAALTTIEAKRAAGGTPATFKLSQDIKQKQDATGYQDAQDRLQAIQQAQAEQ